MALFLLRDSNRGSDYQVGDIVEVWDDIMPDPYVLGQFIRRCPALPPAAPFWLVRVQGITKEQALPYFSPEYDANGNVIKKRLWQLRQQRVPNNYSSYLLAHRFLGFGNADDVAFYGTTVSGDFILNWSEVGTWIYNKTTRQYAV